MRKFIAIVTTLFLLISLVSCKNGERKNNSELETSSSSSTSGDLTTPNAETDNNLSQPNNSSKPNSSSKNPSSSRNASSSRPGSSLNVTTTSSNSNSNWANGDLASYTICYHSGQNNTSATTFYTDYWKMPFAREDDGAFTRDGYVLIGYSFDPNGNGKLIRPGYKYSLPSNNATQNLYCVWAKETNPANFKTTQNSANTVYITAYNGSDAVVYIPRKIGGKTVVGIAAEAFANNRTLTEVHITSSVLTVEERAFASCSNLKTVTLYDSLNTISDASFIGSTVKTVRMCAGKAPRYMKTTYGIKYERLVKTKGQKRVIVVAGSSAVFGIDTDYMQGLFKNDYTVVNFGTNGNMNIPFYLDAISPHLTSSDIVVFSPEQYGPYAYHTNGNPEMPSPTLQGIATCYNLFENIDASYYTQVFDAIGLHCVQTSRMPALSWNDCSVQFDEFGDLVTIPTAMNSPNFCYGANGTFRFNETVIPSQFIPNLNRIIDKTKQTGAKVVFSYPPHNRNNIEKDSLREESFNAYNQWISKTVHCPLISDVRNYIYNGEYFANTDYHLNAAGRKLHTKQLATDIINANIGVN